MLIHIFLSPRIDEQQRRAAEAIYFETLQLAPTNNVQWDSHNQTDNAELLGLRAPQRIYIARQNNRVAGIVLPLTAREGYGGDIDLLLGVDPNGKIISVRVISHHETRGIGDKIESDKSGWLHQFEQQTLDEAQKNRWQLRNEGGDFDGMTGATVTSHAAIKAVRQGLEYFSAHRAELLQSANDPPIDRH